jgi:hypothetical protein
MRNQKAIISALSKDDACTITKNVTITDIYVGELDEDTGRCAIIVTLDKDVKGMVKVTKRVIDDAAVEAEDLKAAADAMPDSTAEEKAAKAEAEDKAKAAQAYADSLELDDYVVATTNRIFLSNFAFIGMLRQNPETMFLVDALKADETLFKRILNHATFNVVAQEVVAGEEYRDPFSTSDTTSTVQNDSVYHTGYGIQLSSYGWEAADEVKAILAEITKARLMAKLAAKTSSRPKHATKTYDEDED